MARLLEHDYPGNVRELQNVIEQAFVLCRGGLIETRHLPPELRPAHPEQEPPLHSCGIRSLERRLIEAALGKHRGHRTRAARELGIDPSTLYRKIRRLGLEVPDADGRHTAR